MGFAYGSDGSGATGVEKLADKTLAGTPGKTVFQRTRYGAPIAGTEEVQTTEVNGADIQTTIDADLQYVAQNAIAETVRKSHAQAGYVIVMEVKTGRLLVVATAPTFDPAKPASVDPRCARTGPSRRSMSLAPPGRS